jgi:hypothetical protein
MWPVPLVVLGQLFVILATRRVMAARQVAELGSEHVDAETESPDEDERWLVPFVAVGFAVRR